MTDSFGRSATLDLGHRADSAYRKCSAINRGRFPSLTVGDARDRQQSSNQDQRRQATSRAAAL